MEDRVAIIRNGGQGSIELSYKSKEDNSRPRQSGIIRKGR